MQSLSCRRRSRCDLLRANRSCGSLTRSADRLGGQHEARRRRSAAPTAPAARCRPAREREARRAPRPASTTARPSAVSVAARPRLNATMSSIPSAIWSWAMAPSSTTSADGQGMSPADAPIATSPRRVELVGRCVRVCRWSWCVVVAVRGARRRRCERRTRAPTTEHEQARHEVQPRVQVLGQHVLPTARASTSPSANTPAVWVTVTVAPSATACRGVPRVPTRYAATIALPWPGDSACSAPHPNAASRSRTSTPWPAAAALNDARSRPPARPPRRRSPWRPSGASSVPSPGADRERRVAHVGRAAEQRPRDSGAARRRVAGRDARAHAPSPARARDDRLPAHAARERAVVQAHRGGPPHARRAAAARRASCAGRPARRGWLSAARPAVRSGTRRPSTVSASPRCTSPGLRRDELGVGQPALLERRDLGLVEDVPHVDAVG